jgi:nucleoside-diphosphate-sugar epimerase
MMNMVDITMTHAMVASKTADAFHGRTILITGGRGYIGSALTQSLVNVNCKLILLDRSPGDAWMPERQRAEVVLLNGDVSMRKTWNIVLPGVHYIFHLAGQEYVHRPEADPLLDLQLNALPILHLLDVCREHQYCPKIVFPSSANLFGLVKSLPISEHHRDAPLVPWAVHKLMAENYLRIYAKKYGVKSVILRLANVYGPTARWSVMTRVVINKMIAKALAGEPLTLYANQSCIRDYVFLEDVVQAFLLAGAHSKSTDGRLYVIGSGDGKTIAEVWQLIADKVSSYIGRNVPIQFDASVKVEPFEMRNFVADTTRFQRATGWKPHMRLRQGIDLTMRALDKNQSRSQLRPRG